MVSGIRPDTGYKKGRISGVSLVEIIMFNLTSRHRSLVFNLDNFLIRAGEISAVHWRDGFAIVQFFL